MHGEGTVEVRSTLARFTSGIYLTLAFFLPPIVLMFRHIPEYCRSKMRVELHLKFIFYSDKKKREKGKNVKC